jgi:hypothetical protein
LANIRAAGSLSRRNLLQVLLQPVEARHSLLPIFLP